MGKRHDENAFTTHSSSKLHDKPEQQNAILTISCHITPRHLSETYGGNFYFKD
jgi:hypothetical protein